MHAYNIHTYMRIKVHSEEWRQGGKVLSDRKSEYEQVQNNLAIREKLIDYLNFSFIHTYIHTYIHAYIRA